MVVMDFDAGVGMTLGHHIAQNTQGLNGSKTWTTDGQSRSRDLPILVGIDHHHVVAVFGQHQCAGQSGNTCSNDQNALVLHAFSPASNDPSQFLCTSRSRRDRSRFEMERGHFFQMGS